MRCQWQSKQADLLRSGRKIASPYHRAKQIEGTASGTIRVRKANATIMCSSHGLPIESTPAGKPAGVLRRRWRLKVFMAQIETQAQEMNLRLIDQLAADGGITEQLKAEDQMAWVGAMMNIQARVREIVNDELIFR